MKLSVREPTEQTLELIVYPEVNAQSYRRLQQTHRSSQLSSSAEDQDKFDPFAYARF